jgi:hypothetical protein
VNVYGTWNKSQLDDEDLEQEILTHLQGIGKYISAMDLARYMDQEDVQRRHKMKKESRNGQQGIGLVGLAFVSQSNLLGNTLMVMSAAMLLITDRTSSCHGGRRLSLGYGRGHWTGMSQCLVSTRSHSGLLFGSMTSQHSMPMIVKISDGFIPQKKQFLGRRVKVRR